MKKLPYEEWGKTLQGEKASCAMLLRRKNIWHIQEQKESRDQNLRGINGEVRKPEHLGTPSNDKHSDFLLSIIWRPWRSLHVVSAWGRGKVG